MEEAGVSRGSWSGRRPTARRAGLPALPHRQVALAAAGSIGALLVVPARYGGEEFVIVFPNCPVGEAEKVVERIQERLGVALYGGTVPPFTASFGLAASDPVLTFSETLEAADASLLQAKIRGRDRIVVAGADTNAVQPASAMTETLSPATP